MRNASTASERTAAACMPGAPAAAHSTGSSNKPALSSARRMAATLRHFVRSKPGSRYVDPMASASSTTNIRDFERRTAGNAVLPRRFALLCFDVATLLPSLKGLWCGKAGRSVHALRLGRLLGDPNAEALGISTVVHRLLSESQRVERVAISRPSPVEFIGEKIFSASSWSTTRCSDQGVRAPRCGQAKHARCGARTSRRVHIQPGTKGGIRHPRQGGFRRRPSLSRLSRSFCGAVSTNFAKYARKGTA